MTLEQQAKARWNKLQGTPRTLEESIRNGINAFLEANKDESGPLTLEMAVTSHVKDFLAQKFTIYMNGSGDSVDTYAQALWEKIIGIS